MTKLKIIRLSTGEEVLSKINEDTTDNFYLLEDAVTLVYTPKSESEMSVGFAPFMPYAENKIIFKSMVVAMGDPVDNIKKEHIRIFSGLILAK